MQNQVRDVLFSTGIIKKKKTFYSIPLFPVLENSRKNITSLGFCCYFLFCETFVMHRYGVGYHLTIAKAADCSESALVSFIQKFVPTGKLVSSVGAEIAFILPSEETKQFPDLFESMEGKREFSEELP